MPDYSKIANQLGFICAFVVVLFGLTVFLGWFFQIEYLKGGMAAGITVKMNTAICFFMAGLAALLQNPLFTSEWKRSLSKSISVFIFLLASLNLSQFIFGLDLGIDQLIFKDTANHFSGIPPNRMGTPASINFMLTAIALFLIRGKKDNFKFDRVSTFAIAIVMISVLSIIGYLFNASQLYGIAKYTSISLPSALAFLCLGISLICIAPSGYLITLFTANDSGGILMRRLLPPAIILPIFFSMLKTWGQDYGYYDYNFGSALLVIVIIFILSRLIWTSALALRKSDERLRQLIESETAAKIQAERANRFKDQFLTTLSHELRTPLNAILGWSQILKRKEPSFDELKKGLDTIERNSRLQAQLIEDLLDMNKIISGKLSLNIAPINLEQVISESIETVEPLSRQKSIRIFYDSQLDQKFVNGDSTRLHQIFWNILSNAIKFTPIKGSITVRARNLGMEALVDISDNGEGIEKDILEHIFDRFTQGDSSITRKHGGLGLGLSIVKELVQAHHGQIKAYSAGLGQGASFTVSLPLATHEKTADNLSIADSSNHILPEGSKILLVDDDLDSLDLSAEILSQNNSKIIRATSCDEALIKLLAERPDIIISDIGMPEKDGYQLIKEIRALKDSRISSMPAIALTAFGKEEEKDRALASGYNIHLTKPINRQMLLAAASRLIDIKSKLQV